MTLDADGTERTLSNRDLATESVAQISASRAFSANLRVLETADEMDRSLLDLKA